MTHGPGADRPRDPNRTVCLPAATRVSRDVASPSTRPRPMKSVASRLVSFVLHARSGGDSMRSRNGRRSFGQVAVAFLGTVALGGGVEAAIPSASGVIHAC